MDKKKHFKFTAASTLNFCFALSYASEGGSHEADLERTKQRFDRGDNSALLDAIYLCTVHWPGRPLPSWVEAAFWNAFVGVKLAHEYESWDEAFGLPHPKNRKLIAKRAEFEKRADLWVRVAELRRKAPHRDHFPAVAKEFGLSVAVAKKYFYATNKLTGYEDPVEALVMLEKFAALLNHEREKREDPKEKRHKDLERKQREAELDSLRTLLNMPKKEEEVDPLERLRTLLNK